MKSTPPHPSVLSVSCLNWETRSQVSGFVSVLFYISTRSLFTMWEELKRTYLEWITLSHAGPQKAYLFSACITSSWSPSPNRQGKQMHILSVSVMTDKLCLCLPSQKGWHHVLRCASVIRKIADRQNWKRNYLGALLLCLKLLPSA